MSASLNNEKCEPNLIPLLDLVLQMVMFFMVCAQFQSEQLNESIKLPEAIAAKSIDKTVDSYVILNIDPQGKVLLGNDQTVGSLDSPVQVANYMKNLFDIDKTRTKPADWEKGRGRSIIILRAHKDCNFKQVHDVMAACRRAGYTDLQLRAKLKNTSEGG